MSGVTNQPGMPDGAYVPRLMRPPVVPVAASPSAAPGLGTDQLALGGAVPDAGAQLAMLRGQIVGGTDVEAAMAIAQLESLGSTHRDVVVPMLIDQLRPGGNPIHVMAAMAVLQRMKAPEAVAHIQALMNDSQPAVRSAAGAAYQAMVPAPAPVAPAPVAAAAAPPVAVDPSRPLTSQAPSVPAAAPAATSAAAAAPAPMGNEALIALFSNPSTAPQAAVQLSQLPIDQVLAVSRQLMDKDLLDPKSLELVVAVLGKRLKEPGVTDLLKTFLRKDLSSRAHAAGKAALLLLSTKDPAFTPDILRVLATFQVRLNPTKRVIIETMAKNPAYMAHPATVPVLSAVLGAQEDAEMMSAASHALGLVKTAQARDALAASPLFKNPDPKLRMRALWDLGAHPAPYPPKAVENLRRLASDTDPTVKAKAKELLEKKA